MEHWLLTSREKFQIWTKFQEIGAKLRVAVVGSFRLEEGWSFFVSQSSSTLSPWWRYAELIYQNQHVVRDLPLLRKGSELFQYHQKIKKDKSEVVPMTIRSMSCTALDLV